MKVTDFRVTMNPEKVVFKFDNLFNGDKELGNNINQVNARYSFSSFRNSNINVAGFEREQRRSV